MAYDGSIIIDTELSTAGFESGIAQLEQMAASAAAGMGEAISTAVSDATARMAGSVTASGSEFSAAGMALGAALGQGFSGGTAQLAASAGPVVAAAANAITAGAGTMSGAGRSLVEGIWQGMQGAQGWLMGRISAFCGQVVAGIRGFFGISSPTKRLADEVGRWLPPGIAQGFDAALPAANRSMLAGLESFTGQAAALVRAAHLAPARRGGAAATNVAERGGGNVYNYSQQVYTHNSLSPYELTQEFEAMRAREGWAIP